MGKEANQPISKSEAWLGMMRISNAPTVASNILVGTALAMQMQGKHFTWDLSFNIFFAICIFAVYFAGMILNDAFDAKYDQQHRPSRPIPSGAVSRYAAWTVGITILGAVSVFGFGHGAANGLILLVTAVLLYTFFHRWFITAVAFMALCRGLVYLIVANPTQGSSLSLLLTFCIALAFYTAVLTFIGRFENTKNINHVWVTWLLLLPPFYVVFTQLPIIWFALIPLVFMVYWIWLAWVDFKANKKMDGMHRILSGFCLVDCVLASTLEQYAIAGLCAVCFVITVGFHRKILGT
ncbi:MAG: UbiA family prenyltransferase [Phycisphaerales bacterium]|nr:UbiA family prenyltransferase [Phycisphaerales bacterium]